MGGDVDDMCISIVGGGIAGITTGLALSSAGFQPTIYEPDPGPQLPSSGIWISPNGMAILRKLGIAAEVEENGVRLDRTVIRDVTGDLIMDVDMDEVTRRYGTGLVSIRRSTLQETLYDVCENVTVERGMAASELQLRDDTYDLLLRDGERVSPDMIVGADGTRSGIRTAIAPNATAVPSRKTYFTGISESSFADESTNVDVTIWGRGTQFGYAPVAADQVYWFAVVPADTTSVTEEPVSRLRDAIGTSFSDFPGRVESLVRSTPAERITSHNGYVVPEVDQLVRKNVGLVGDAAHALPPTLAQGGAQAMEDAYVLARMLSRSPSVSAGLQAYESMRLPRVREILDQSVKRETVAEMKQWPLPWLRKLVLRNLPDAVDRVYMDKLYDISDIV